MPSLVRFQRGLFRCACSWNRPSNSFKKHGGTALWTGSTAFLVQFAETQEILVLEEGSDKEEKHSQTLPEIA